MGVPRLPIALLGVVASACSSSPGGVPPTPESQAFSYVTNLIPVSVGYGGASATGIVDTGNPWVLLDPTVFTSAASLPGNGVSVPTIDIASQTVSNVYVVPSNDGLQSPDPAFPLAANVGCAGICGKVAGFNYRDAVFSLGTSAPSPPSGLLAEKVFPFSFEGGSVVDGVTLPRSRIVVTVSLEGTDYQMILDSGASSVTVSATAYAALTTDGRAQLDGGTVETTSGTSTSSLTRAKSIVVGGVEVDNVVVAHDTSFDQNLGAIGTDVGHTIDGSLGGTFLHDFYVTVDYPAREVHLARYSDLSFAVDPAERLGIELAPGISNSYVVAAVSSTATAQGISAGDQVVSIDGVDLAGLALAQVGVLEFGAVGQTKQVVFGQAVNVPGKTLEVAIEELLPL